MKNNTKKNNVLSWKWDLLGVIIPLFILISLYNKYNIDSFKSPSHNYGAYGSMLRLIDKLWGKKFVYGFLLLSSLLFLFNAYREYVKEKKLEMSRLQKNIIQYIKMLTSISLIGAFVVLPTYAYVYYRNIKKQIQNSGKETIAYVFEVNKTRHQKIKYDSNIFYFVDSVRFEIKTSNYITTTLHKFYKVKYLSNNPYNSLIDFKHEISPDSVYKYFPKGKNPFEEEIKQVKTQKPDSNGVVLYEY